MSLRAGALASSHQRRRRGSDAPVVPVPVVVAAAIWAVVAAIALGGVLGDRPRSDDTASVDRVLRGDGFALTASPSWSPVRPARDVRAAGFERPLVLARGSSPGPRLAVETIPPLRARARPDELALRAHAGAWWVDEEGLASGLRVWRSAAPDSAAGGELLVAPTTGGLLTAACFSARPWDCDEVVRTLRPVGGKALRLTAEAPMQIALPAIAERLRADRRAARARITSRRDAATWPAGATAAAEAFGRAARSLERVAAGSAHGPSAISALRTTSLAYTRLAAAGRSRDVRAWARERRAVMAGERRAAAALRAAGGSTRIQRPGADGSPARGTSAR